jgi:hypothetical protein
VRTLVDNAIDGDTTAVRECFDRMDGKVTQGADATDQVRGDITFTWMPSAPSSETLSRSKQPRQLGDVRPPCSSRVRLIARQAVRPGDYVGNRGKRGSAQ